MCENLNGLNLNGLYFGQILQNEINLLREELYNLKKCQITFFSLSITATGLLISIAGRPEITSLKSTFFLAPLVILIPCWWIFFDKATTITRIVGYYRIIESLLINNKQSIRYIGWENALRDFRHRQNKIDMSAFVVKPNIRRICDLFFLFRKAHSFWVTIWYTYFLLSLLCLMLGFFSHHDHWSDIMLLSVATIMFFFSIVITGKMVWRLVYGKNSYDVNEKVWEIILSV